LVSSQLAPALQILEIFRVIGVKPHHHDKVADHGGVNLVSLTGNLIQTNYAIRSCELLFYANRFCCVAASTTTTLPSTTPRPPTCPNPDVLAVYDFFSSSDYLTLEYPVNPDVVSRSTGVELSLRSNEPQEIMLESHDVTKVDFMEMSFSVKYAESVTLNLMSRDQSEISVQHPASTDEVS